MIDFRTIQCLLIKIYIVDRGKISLMEVISFLVSFSFCSYSPLFDDTVSKSYAPCKTLLNLDQSQYKASFSRKNSI